MTTPPTALPRDPRLRRYDMVDAARGVALLAMFVFHFAYDLSYFGLIETQINAEPGWRWFARTIAASFLTVVGVSLYLATRNGLDRRSYVRRLAMVAAAAAAVTLATWLAMRENFIFFGILHHIALASVIALPFLRLPTIAIALAAALIFAAPYLIDHPVFDETGLIWLGLAASPVRSADFVPVLPWFGWVLTGIAAARVCVPLLDRKPAAWQATGLPARVLVWGGRNSLLVYLVHQPIFIGTILLAAQAVAAFAPEERPFMISCQRSCAAGAVGAQACDALCSCTVDALKRENLWRQALANTLDNRQSARVSELARACIAPGATRP